jgi:hypothetical protein
MEEMTRRNAIKVVAVGGVAALSPGLALTDPTKASVSVEQRIELIRGSLDLTKVIDKARENHRWNEAQTAEATEWYLKHLALSSMYPNKPIAAISRAGDDVWHQHVLDTRKYAADCHHVFGRFLDHVPIYGAPSAAEKAAYAETVAMYRAVFGRLPMDLALTSAGYSYGLFGG